MKKIIVKLLACCVIFGVFNAVVRWLAGTCARHFSLTFVGILAGGNLKYSGAVIDVAREALTREVGKLWHY